MKHLVTAVILAGMVSMLPNPQPADAQQDGKSTRCLLEAIKECDEEFAGNDIYMAAARGYCYMIRATICRILDKSDLNTF